MTISEATVRWRISLALRDANYWPVAQTDATKCGKCGSMFYPAKGRPDLMVLHPRAPSVVVEVKIIPPGGTNLAFSRITDEQRSWLTRWLKASGAGFIGLGLLGLRGTRRTIDDIYLVPWHRWLDAEALLLPHRKSIPVDCLIARKKAIREFEMDVPHMFQGFQLARKSGARWSVPRDHIAYPTIIA